MNDEVNDVKQEASSSESPKPAAKEPLAGVEDQAGRLPVEFLSDVPMKLTVELGVGDISLRELLQLGHGAVFELDKLAGEPLEVKVNNRLVSRGEVVVVNDRYAIRLTDVINPEEINS